MYVDIIRRQKIKADFKILPATEYNQETDNSLKFELLPSVLHCPQRVFALNRKMFMQINIFLLSTYFSHCKTHVLTAFKAERERDRKDSKRVEAKRKCWGEK
jgi:hypothetical protein